MGSRKYNKRIAREKRKADRRKLPETSVKSIKEEVRRRINTQIKNRIKELKQEE